MNIVRAQFEDAEAILTVQKSAFLREADLYNNHSILPLLETVEALQQDISNKLVLVAKINGEIVGSGRAYLNSGTCFVVRLSVRPAQ